MNIGEFFVSLGVKADFSSLKKFAESMGDIPVETAAAILAIGGIEYKLGQLAVQAVQTAEAFAMFEATTGLSFQGLQKWQMAAERVGVSGEAVASSIKTIQQNMIALQYGFGNAKPFAFLGINPRGKNPIEVLTELRRVMGTMSRDKFNYWSSQLGVSQEMLRVLELSNSEFIKFTTHVSGMTKQQEKDFTKVKEALVGISQVIKNEFMRMMDLAIILIEKFWHGLMSLSIAQKLALVGLIALATPFASIAAAIGVVLLLLDDLYGYFAGEDSVTGRGLKGLQKFADEVKKIFSATGAAGLTSSVLQKTMNAALMAPMAPMMPLAGAAGMMGNKTVNFTIHAAGETVDAIKKVVEDVLKREFHATEQNIDNSGHN